MRKHLKTLWQRNARLGVAIIMLASSLFMPAHASEQETVFTYRSPESGRDERFNYDKAALELALEKTRQKYGPYRLVGSPPMTFTRAISSASANEYPNFFIKLSYEERFAQLSLDYARFPVDLGIVGYRICFTHPDNKEKLASVQTLEELTRFTHGQGRDWSDVQILRHNGFRVTEVAGYESLFEMVASRRFDLFCRGANELLREYKAHRHIPHLSYDESIVLAYPLPRFFFANAANKVGIERIREGLVAAYKDGSLQTAWRENYQESIDFVQLGKRRIFRLENPFLKKVDFDYQQYFYNPFVDAKRKR